ncbi:ethanolamine ammonia-lyase subunit EutB [Arcticibacterium luteifluviistationis]|uniref:Ethanolamine ammonia-lyase large subunit n=1 Tax=Arcticibacterium luteifluviistationis TaxID=1784714 RepID=A0A2Z4GDI9_9BACT|nr:ethanolamine ammonia-lyase subunit EutB [Arcticibacterium luteifluviistationis]AWV99224.1 ethanolamine ammonia lyase large subunit [Arcticibacterium luteifluviistationis]
MSFKFSIGHITYAFSDLKELMAKATPFRTGDALAGLAAESNQERVAAQFILADLPLKTFLNQVLIPYEKDEVTRLILDEHDLTAFTPISHFTVGQLRDWLLTNEVDNAVIKSIGAGLTPEMVAAVSKLMRNQDLIAVAQKCENISKFRSTVGLKGRLSVRLQPNNPTDNAKGIAASILDGLMYGCGDAVIGINPATDSPESTSNLLNMLEEIRLKFEIPTQSCILSHVTTTLEILNKAPVDLTFQSIAGTEKANTSFGINLSILKEAYEATKALNRGEQVMYFETGQGSALSANAHHGVDQQTCEARAYAVARKFDPFLVNSVVGFIGPEYLYDGKQIIRAALEDHFCGKILGLPMGMDVCYTNHAEADQDDMDNLMTLLGVAGVNFIMGVPGADDIMLNYQSTSFHDAFYLRKVLNKKPAPEFEAWLLKMGITDKQGKRLEISKTHHLLNSF